MIEEPTTGYLGLTTILRDHQVRKERRWWLALGDKVAGLIALTVLAIILFG